LFLRGLFMFNKCRIVLLGFVVSQGTILVAMEKKPESPQSPRRHLLSCSAELRKSNDQLRKETLPIQISSSKNRVAISMCYNNHCGSRSPVEYWIPYHYESTEKSSVWQSDCP